MKLNKFIKKINCDNALIRLVYETGDKYEPVTDTWEDVSTVSFLRQWGGRYKNYLNNKVFGLASIQMKNRITHPEAINIIIKNISKKEEEVK